MAGIRRRPGTQYAALVPNDKGAVRAVDAGVDAIHTVLSASESHNLANVNMTIAESLEKLRAVLQVAARAGVGVACGISTSFGCPFEGDVPVRRLESDRGPARRHGRAGLRPRRHHRHGQPAPGRGGPRAPDPALPRGGVDAPHARHAGHGHSEHPGRHGMRGDALRQLHRRARRLPVRAGRLRQRVQRGSRARLHAMGVETGIDLDRLLAVSRRVETIVGRALPGQIVKAGPWTRRYPLPDGVAARLSAARCRRPDGAARPLDDQARPAHAGPDGSRHDRLAHSRHRPGQGPPRPPTHREAPAPARHRDRLAPRLLGHRHRRLPAAGRAPGVRGGQSVPRRARGGQRRGGRARPGG